VTGGAGFIGSHCVDAFLDRGNEVTVLDIKKKDDAKNLAHTINDITYLEGDIRDIKSTKKHLEEHTHVLHLAANVSVQESLRKPIESHTTNVTGTLSVFEAAYQCGVKRVVYASSAAVYGDTEIVPTPENAALLPLSPYGLHKQINELHAQFYTRQYGLSTIGLRFFNVFGSRQDSSSPYSGVVSIFAEKIREGKPLTVFGDGNASRDFMHVSNVVNACIAGLTSESGVGNIYNVGSGKETSIHELISVLTKGTKSESKVAYAKAREGDIVRSCASIERIVNELGYGVQCNFEKGIKEILTNV